MTEPQFHYVRLETKYLDESSQRELSAYRRLGSVKELARLKRKEMMRRERRLHFDRALDRLLAGAIFSGTLVGILFILFIFA